MPLKCFKLSYSSKLMNGFRRLYFSDAIDAAHSAHVATRLQHPIFQEELAN